MGKLGAVLAAVVLSGCVGVTYQGAGERITPRAGETLVFGRLRFFHDGREFFPWSATLAPSGVATPTERHLWLLRLGRRAVSAEVHPDGDGSLAIWLAPADYALLGSIEVPTEGSAPYEVIALLRVPAGPVAAYAGELGLTTETHEGSYLARGELGAGSVTVLPLEIARKTLEQRLGTLPEEPVLSPWCAGEQLPGFSDSQLAPRAKTLLDGGCAGDTQGSPVGSPHSSPSLEFPQSDTGDPARIPIYGTADRLLGHVVLGRSTPADAERVLGAIGGLGPARPNEVEFTVGGAALRPGVVYTPPSTLHQLYFDRDTLVLVVAAVPHGLPETRSDFGARFPEARETRRESTWYELQVPLGRCVWLIAVLTSGTDRLESHGVARACPAGSGKVR